MIWPRHDGECCCSPGVDLARGKDGSIESILAERQAFGDATAESIGADLKAIAEKLGAALDASIAEGGDSAKASINATQLQDVLDLLEGLEDEDGVPLIDKAQAKWVDALRQIAERVAAQAEAEGLPAPDGFNATGYAEAIKSKYRNAADLWETLVVRPLAFDAQKVFEAQLWSTDFTQAARGTAEDLKAAIPAIVQEVRTETAAFDRYTTAALATAADPAGDQLVWVYAGPKDGLQRKFCRLVMGIAWTREQVTQLINGVPGMPPIIYGGGWNCRHQWLQMSRRMADARELRYATDDDVAAVNADVATGRR